MRVLLADLNNFARYPTIAIGLLAACLREHKVDVDVFSPLSVGVQGVVRESRPAPWGALEARLRHWTATTPSRPVRRLRQALVTRRSPMHGRFMQDLIRAFATALEARPDVVLISTYLMYFDVCRALVQRCKEQGVPVILGGSYFSQPEIVEAWSALGATAIVGGEPELFLHDLVQQAASDGDLSQFPGVTPAGAKPRPVAPPLTELDSLPFPDYSDFPWDRYPSPITPMLTGRGCGWGVCRFCSDVTSAMGRTFRSRSASHVLDELVVQNARQKSAQFVFTDLKVNSDASVWEALLSELPGRMPHARWIGAVHVDGRGGVGLSAQELRAARAAGMVRLTTGLESGSQRVLDQLGKGTELGETARFLHDAKAAGISTRVTMILGSPGEEPSEVEASAAFLERHADCIERVTLNRFLLMMGTPLHRERAGLGLHAVDVPIQGVATLEPPGVPSKSARRAVARLLDAVHRINRRPLSAAARPFEGVM